MQIYTAKGAEYVYGELCRVASDHRDDGEHDMTGQYSAMLRWNFGPQSPSTAVVIDLRQAQQLRDDLNRILREHHEQAHEDSSDQELFGQGNPP